MFLLKRLIPRTPFRRILAGVTMSAGAAGVCASLYMQRNFRAYAEELQAFERREIPLEALPSRDDVLMLLQAPDQEFDVLVIGGGATGVGIALDAQTRGLKTALVERDDFAAGTSSRSTKLIHGGVRYLEKAFLNLDKGQYDLVQEALRERDFFFKVAPHLSRPLPIILPIYDSFPSVLFYAPYYWIGCKAYDLVAGKHALEPSHWLSRREALEKFPMLKRAGLKGGTVYYDGQMNDTRICLAVAQTAMAHGARCANHVEVMSLLKDPATGRVCGAHVRDQVSGREWNIRAKSVINATGPFSDSIRKMDDASARDIIAPSAGVHIMLADRYSPEGMGLIAPSSDGRVLFLLPWEKSTIAGTTDSSSAITSLPRPHEEEIEFILREIRKFLEVNVKREDVDAAWSGIRPLARDPNAKNTESISRDHVIEVSPSGLLTIAGGKWTTFRKMAEDSVDRVITTTPELAKRSSSSSSSSSTSPIGPCVSERLALLGSAGWSLAAPTALVRRGLPLPVAEHLSHNYGDKAGQVASLVQARPALGAPLATGFPFIEAEVLYAVQHEFAVTAVDVLARRTRLAFLHKEAAESALPRVVQLMGDELLWSEARRRSETEKATEFLKTMGNQGRRAGAVGAASPAPATDDAEKLKQRTRQS